MIKCVFIFVLTNMVYCSLGLPVTNTDVPLAKSLQSLANHCENTFLATQINSKIDACNFSFALKKISEGELECFIFYDINRQLCSAFRASKFDLSQSYASRMSTVQKVNVTCEESKNWKFTKQPEHAKYDNISEIFQKSATCLRACAVHDLMSEDTNFYCQYYQWGVEMLQVLATTIGGKLANGVNNAPETALLETPSRTDGSSSAPVSAGNKNLPKEQIVNEQSQEAPTNVELPKLDTKDESGKADAAASSTNAQHVINESGDKPKVGVVKNSSTATNISDTSENKELKQDLPSKKKTDSDILLDQNEINDDKQQQSADPDEDNENDFDSDDDAPPESQPANIANMANNPGVLPDPKIDDDKTKRKDVASIVSSLNVEMSQREFSSNTMQDGFAEDDDHFFSFFLTAIILVVFLYVLYHNKSKFRKVFLGLLVEGRQSGRRRNSRGHEYRRLDTLEQAMSTNSAAPPSKIIY